MIMIEEIRPLAFRFDGRSSDLPILPGELVRPTHAQPGRDIYHLTHPQHLVPASLSADHHHVASFEKKPVLKPGVWPIRVGRFYLHAWRKLYAPGGVYSPYSRNFEWFFHTYGLLALLLAKRSEK